MAEDIEGILLDHRYLAHDHNPNQKELIDRLCTLGRKFKCKLSYDSADVAAAELMDCDPPLPIYHSAHLGGVSPGIYDEAMFIPELLNANVHGRVIVWDYQDPLGFALPAPSAQPARAQLQNPVNVNEAGGVELVNRAFRGPVTNAASNEDTVSYSISYEYARDASWL